MYCSGIAFRPCVGMVMKYICFRKRYRIKSYVRSYSQFKATVNLPKTSFALNVSNKSKHEEEIQQICKFHELYKWQLEANSKCSSFILHDGPPYANGDVHVGHALNKILKDITNRFKLLHFHKINYKPGWDCHGLPIEIKAIKSKQLNTLSTLQIREKAKSFAESTIIKQREAFKKWGVMADWDNPDGCYFTFNRSFQDEELKYFYEMFKKKLVYRDLKPIFWSPSSQSALAESELEYNEKHISRSAYVEFPLTETSLISQKGLKAAVLVWTTQPWTLPANEALCYGCDIQYSFIKVNDDRAYLVATDVISRISSELGIACEILNTFDATCLESLRCLHPMDSSRQVKLLPASHATTDKGTGIVHTAPAHGVEDFQVALEHSLPLESNVDDTGCFTTKSGFNLQGKYIFTDGNDAVIDALNQNNTLFHISDFIHSYPYDWRTKKEIFVKTSRQWFIDTNKLKEPALSALSNINFIPSTGKSTMEKVLQSRPYWCISRQRVWGVPIPVFYHKESGDVLINDVSINHIRSLIKKHGPDVWFSSSISELLPKEALYKAGFTGSCEDFEAGKDILDIWFDSGITWATVLNYSKNNSAVADLYLEGKDQYNGWFQSSLLTSVALQGVAPYKTVFVHGFCVAKDGKKMSKSLGNVIDPMVIVEGGKNKTKEPCYGADTLRWWVAQSNITQTHISKTILDDSSASIQKIRICLRYLLSNLNEFNRENLILENRQIQMIDLYFLDLLKQFIEQVTDSYNSYKYTHVCKLILNYITKLSNVYFSIIKDRLYCEEKDGFLRRSAQTTIFYHVDALIKSVAPILPHLAEEAIMHHPCSDSTSAFKHGWFDVKNLPTCDQSSTKAVIVALSLRDSLLSLISSEKIMQPTGYNMIVCTRSNLLASLLHKLQPSESSKESSLCEIFSCAQCTLASVLDDNIDEALVSKSRSVTIDDNEVDCVIAAYPSKYFKCPRCRKLTSTTVGHLCNRCTNVLSNNWDL